MNIQLRDVIVQIESELSQYKSSGLLDKASLYYWAARCLQQFGQSVCTLHERVVHINNGKGKLPKNFHSLHLAAKCSWKGFNCEKDDVELLQSSLVWKELISKHVNVNNCNPCCLEECETTVTENVYFNERAATIYYDNLVPMQLSKSVIRDACADDCRNKLIKSSPYTIDIKGTTIYTNFPEGVLYVLFYGIEEDEEGVPIIPETSRGDLLTYLEYHLKRKIVESAASNNEDVNALSMLKFYFENEEYYKGKAMADVKYNTLTPDVYKRFAQRNRSRIKRIESIIAR